MKKAILAKKLGMTQVFAQNGKMTGVTVLEAGPCTVVQKKTIENESYSAIQVGFSEIPARKIIKPLKGHFNKAGTAGFKVLREFKLETADSYQVGDVIRADIFKEGDFIDVSGVSKGKGFQGAIKRHKQSRGPMSHGSKYHRGLGSLSSATTPGKVKKGKKMPGHMGNKRVSVQNLEIIRVDSEKNIILVKGPVPGPKGTVLFVKNTVKG